MTNQTASKRKVENYWYLLLVPVFAILVVIEFYPLLYSFYLSLGGSGGLTIGNYTKMVTDKEFWSSVITSLAFSIFSTIIAIGVGLGLTFLVKQEFRGRGWFEGLFILPLAMAPIAVGVEWGPAAFWDDFQAVTHFGLGFPFFNELSILFYFPVMAASEAWEWAPLIMLVALSIINSTPKEIYEAARLSGASSWQVFSKIMVPAVFNSPVMQFVLVLRFIDAMNSFAVPLDWSTWVGFSNSVGSPVDTLSLFLYKLLTIPSFNFPIGLVSAVAFSLLVVTLVSATLLMRVLGRISR